MTRPLVTIGIPTYNRADGLRRAVGSALAQDYSPIEVVISDNGSSDGTAELVRQLAEADQRVRSVRHQRNQGATANFMAALAAAGGAYFMWLADDDAVATNYVSECVRVLEAEPRAVLVAGVGRLRSTDGREEVDAAHALSGDRPDQRVLGYYRTVGRNSVIFGVAPTEALRVAGPIRNLIGGDWLFVAALAFAGTVHTVPTTFIERSADGRSDNLRHAARSYGLGWFPRTLPRVSLALSIACDILTSSTYGSLSRRRRLVLAAACAGSAGWRVGVRFHLVRGYVFFRDRLKRSSIAATRDLGRTW